jgi:hypothetical protein
MLGGFSDGTRTFGPSPRGYTTNLKDQGEKRKDEQRPAPRGTANAIDQSVKGDDTVKDRLLAGEGTASPDAARRAGTERRRLAQGLVEAARRLKKARLQSQRATLLVLLKRELARARAALAHHPSEDSYKAILTLVEGALAATRWGDLGDFHHGLLVGSLASGLAEGPVGAEEYLRHARTLHGPGVRAGPTFELNVEGPAGGDEHDMEEPADEPSEA